MIKKYTSSYTTNLILQAAVDLNYRIGIIHKNLALVEIVKNQKKLRVMGLTLDLNTGVSTKIVKNKYLTSLVLSRLGPIVPSSKIINIENKNITANTPEYKKVKKFQKKHGAKIVIKPVDLNSGKGISILPKSEDEIIKAINNVKKYSKIFLVEAYITAENEYRMLAYKNQIVDVVQRFPPQVVGNGRSTIKELLAQQNEFRKKNNQKTFQNYDIHQEFLKKSHLSFESVPEKDRKIVLSKICNFSMGGNVSRIPISNIHTDYSKLIEGIHQMIGINYYGVDLMSNDITSPINNDTTINEVNSAPGLRIHHFAGSVQNKPLLFAKRLLQAILENNEC